MSISGFYWHSHQDDFDGSRRSNFELSLMHAQRYNNMSLTMKNINLIFSLQLDIL